jgi:hypothetical protein
MNIRATFLGFCAFALSLASAKPANAQNNCKLHNLQGAYGYTVTGTIVTNTTQAPLQPGPFAAVGRIVFDGKGGVSTVRTLSDNGTVIRNDAGTGTYTVNSDCTGSFNITVTTAVLDLDFVLDDNNQIRAIVTNDGFVLTLVGRKQQ